MFGSITKAPAQNLPTLSYRQVLDMYDTDRKSGVFTELTLPEYAQQMNQMTQSQMFDSAKEGSVLKRASASIDQVLDESRLPQLSGELFGSVGSLIGQEQNFAAAGAGLPRAAVNMAPMIAAAPVGGALALGGLAASSGLAGADAYEKTGSAQHGLFAAGTTALMPAVFGKAQQAALGGLGASLTDDAGRLVGETMAQRLGGYGAGQTAAMGLGEVGHQIPTYSETGQLDLSTDHFIQSAVSQIPFLAWDLPSLTGHQAVALKAAKTVRDAEAAKVKTEAASRSALTENLFGPRPTEDNTFATDLLARKQSELPTPKFKSDSRLTPGEVEAPVTYTPTPGVMDPSAPAGPGLDIVGRNVTTDWTAPKPTTPTLFGKSLNELMPETASAGLAKFKTTPDPVIDEAITTEPKGPKIKRPVLSDQPTGLGRYERVDTQGRPVDEYGRLIKSQPEAKPAVEASSPLAPKPTGKDALVEQAMQFNVFNTKVRTPEKPVPSELETQIAPMLAEKDAQKAITGIKEVYEKNLKPFYGLQDVVLDEVSDASLQTSILKHMEAGDSLEMAVERTTQGVKNALVKAKETAKSTIFKSETNAKLNDLLGTIGKLNLTGVDPTLLLKIIDVGASMAQDLSKAGAIKLESWQKQFFDMWKSNGLDERIAPLDKTLFSRVQQEVLAQIGESGPGAGDIIRTKERQKLEAVTEQLNKLDDNYNVLPDNVRKSFGHSPLRKVSNWMNQIVKGKAGERYMKYAEVDEAMLKAAGDLRWENGSFVNKQGRPLVDQAVKRYLENAAEFAYKYARRGEMGGLEVVKGSNGEDLTLPINEARIKADELNREYGITDQSSYYFDVQQTEKIGGTGTIVKKQRLLAEPEMVEKPGKKSDETENESDVELLPDEQDPLIEVSEDGEVIDPMHDTVSVVEKIRAEAGDEAADVARQDIADKFNSMLDRLDPINQTLMDMGVREIGKFVSRARVYLELLRDTRTGGIDAKLDHALAVEKARETISEPSWQFADLKEANNWWNGTGRKQLFKWMEKQPEVREWRAEKSREEAAKKRAKEKPYVQPNVAKRALELEETLGPVSLDAVGEARNVPSDRLPGPVSVSLENFTPRGALKTALSFAKDYFARRGMTPEQGQHYADAVERVLRVANTFKHTEETTFARGKLPDGAAAAAFDLNLDKTWTPLVVVGEHFNAPSDVLGAYLGHEAWHIVEAAHKRGLMSDNERATMDHIVEQAGLMDEGQRTSLVMSAIKDVNSPQLNAYKDLSTYVAYSASTPREFLSTLAGLYSLKVARGEAAGVKQTLIHGDGIVARFINTIAKAASELGGAIRGFFGHSKAGLTENRGLDEGSMTELGKFTDAFRELAKTPAETEKAVRQLMQMEMLKPENVFETLRNSDDLNIVDLEVNGRTQEAAQISEVMEIAYAKMLKKGDPNEIGKVPAFISDFVQLTEVHPVLKPIIGELMTFRAHARNAAMDAMSPFSSREYVQGRTVIKEAGKSLQKVAKSLGLRKAINDQILDEQEVGRFLDQGELNELYKKHALTPDEQKHLAESRQGIANANGIIANQLKQYAKWQITHSAARMLMAGNDTPYVNAIKASERITQAAMAAVEPLPAGVDPAQLINSAITEFGLDPNKVMATQMALGDMIGKYVKLREQVDGRPWYVTEQRFGRYSASYKQAGSKLRGRISAESRTELENRVAGLERDTRISDIQRYDNSDQALNGLNRDIVASFQDIGRTAFQKTVGLLGESEARAVEEAFSSFSREIDKELGSRGVGKFLQQRTHAPGREHLDMLENTLRFINSVPYALTKTWMRDRASVAMLDPTFQQNPSAKRVAEQHIKNVLAPVSQFEAKAKEWTFLYYLGGNLSSAMVELAQPVMALPAQLVKDGSTVAQAAGYSAKAYKEVAQAYKNNKFSNPLIDNMVFRLEQDGLLEAQTTGYFFDGQNVSDINLSRLTEGKLTPLTAAQVAGNKLGHLTSITRALYSRATGVSSRVTAVAATMRAIELGMTPDASYQYVRRVMTLTAPGTAGTAGRPVGFYSGDGALRSAAGVVGSLQGFTISMTSMMTRLVHDAVKSGSIKGPDAKAAMLMVGTQLVAAGIMGLPGVGAALAIANQVSPGFLTDLKTGLAGLMGDDAEMGQVFSDAAMRGLPNLATGIDLSARLGLSNMLGVSSYDGFQLKNLLGAPGGIVSNLQRAGSSAIEGNFGDALEQAAPTSIRNVVKLYRNGGEVRGAQDELLYSPNAAEQVAMGIGFTPKRLADMREYKRLSNQSDLAARSELTRFLNNVATLIEDKKMGEARQVLVDRERANPSEFSAVEGLRAAIDRLQSRTMPEDPRRGGSKLGASQRSDLLQSYGIQGPAPSEAQRLQNRQMYEQAFGLHGGVDQTDIVRATMVDQLMMSDPRMTRSQAREAVARRFRQRPPQSL